MILMGGGLGFFDLGVRLFRQTLYRIDSKADEQEVHQSEKKLKKDKSIMHRRVTNINCKLIARAMIYRPRFRVLLGARTCPADHREVHLEDTQTHQQAHRLRRTY